MCMPMLAAAPALSAMLPALTAGAGILSAAGTFMQARAASQAAKNNAKMQEWMRDDAIQRGQNEEARHRMRVAQMTGQQRAAMAAGGRDITSGSAMAVLEDTALMGELDALTIDENARREAYGHSVAASNYRNDARQSMMAGAIGAGSSLLATGGRVAESWYKYRPAGA